MATGQYCRGIGPAVAPSTTGLRLYDGNRTLKRRAGQYDLLGLAGRAQGPVLYPPLRLRSEWGGYYEAPSGASFVCR
jgi:hypothetical protein